MKDTVINATRMLVALAIGASVVYLINRAREPHTGPETVLIERVDTLVVRDTITAYKPVPFNVYVVDTLYVPVTVNKTDTIWAQLPREAKEYRDPGDTLYRAVVSGYEPSLDTLEVYRKTMYIDRERTVYVEPRKWSVGIQAGYGASKDGLSPYIGIGVQYNLWTPQRRKAPP